MRMPKIFSAAAWLGFLLLFSFTDANAKDEWVKARSKNFQLVGNAAESDVRQVAENLEEFRGIFSQFFPAINHESAIPVKVVVLKDEKTLSDFKPFNEENQHKDWTKGFFQSGETGNYIVLSTESEKAGDYRTIFHEYAHFLLNNDFGRTNLPAWFNEGLAEYYETFKIGNNRKATLGNASDEHLLVFETSKMIPLETFFETDYYSLQKQGNHGAGLFYAQSWTLMHYLMRADNPKRNAQFSKYVELLLNGKKQQYAFTEAFQTDYKTLETELKKYIEQKSFRAETIDFRVKSPNENEIQLAPATDAEAKIVLASLLYQSERYIEAAAILEDAAKFDASAACEAISLLGLLKLKQGKTNEALKYLEKAVALDDENYLAQYRYAFFLSREGMTDYGFVSGYTTTQAARIREALDKAIKLNPNYPESYNLYAFVNYVRNESLDQALEYINRALKFAPGNQQYQTRVAELSMLKKDYGKARNLARKIFETAPDERLRVYAKNLIYTIDTYESQMESLKNPFRRRLNDVTDKPLTEEESARLNWLALLTGINENLRRLREDEKRVLGYITGIECSPNGIEYSVKTADQTLKLRSETFDTLMLMTYTADERGGQIGCGARSKSSFAVVGYRPATKENAKTAGELISIEFVPKNFRFLN
jgi:Tfp pilus assembly protein PilF